MSLFRVSCCVKGADMMKDKPLRGVSVVDPVFEFITREVRMACCRCTTEGYISTNDDPADEVERAMKYR